MDAISCVAAPALLSCSFADAAIARALHFSLSDAAAPAPEPELTDMPAAMMTPFAPSTCCEPAVAPRHGHAGGGAGTPRGAATAPSSARCRLGPAAGGRAGKRRPRPSKRAPTTYISTDAATFRLMVQHVTGAQAEPQDVDADFDAGLGLLLPPYDVEPLLQVDAAAALRVPAYIPPAPPSAVEQPCFPTLDSWNVMYGKNKVP